MCEKTPQMLAVKVDFQVVTYRVRHKGLMRALWCSPFSPQWGVQEVDLPIRYVEYAAFRDVMDVYVFCFWQRVLGSIQPPTTMNIFVVFTSYSPAKHVIVMNYATILPCTFYHKKEFPQRKKMSHSRVLSSRKPTAKVPLEKEDWKVTSLYFWNLCLCKDHVKLQGYIMEVITNPFIKQGRSTKLSLQNHGQPGNFGRVNPPKFNREFTPEKWWDWKTILSFMVWYIFSGGELLGRGRVTRG